MQLKRHFSLKFVFLVPLVLSSVIFALTVKNYYDSVNRDIGEEYARIHRALSRAAKIITTIDYSFTNYSKAQYIFLLEHNRQLKNGVCQMWPIDALLLADGRSQDMPAIDINYMLVGKPSLCEPESEVYQRVSGQVSLAPVLSFMHDIDDSLLGVNYIDKEGYLMSSPDTYAKGINAELLDTLKARPFWQQTLQSPDVIMVRGPSPIAATNVFVLSLSMPVNLKGELQGILSLDIDYDKLVNTKDKFASKLSIIDSSLLSLPDGAMRVQRIQIEGVLSSHDLYYAFDLPKEIANFFYFERYSLLVVAFVYVFSVIVLFFINTRVEHSYFKELAAKDPMTGLLNRRGLEAYLSNAMHGKYVAIAVLDIDNFKSINDTYGHDVGDVVISYIADQISYGIRSSDVAARFGGEEFVIYLNGSDKASLEKSLLRVQQAITAHSKEVLASGFTVSGGVEIVKGTHADNFDELFKAADEKLYRAKTTGKDKLVF